MISRRGLHLICNIRIVQKDKMKNGIACYLLEIGLVWQVWVNDNTNDGNMFKILYTHHTTENTLYKITNKSF